MRLAGDDGEHVLMALALSGRIARNPLHGRWEVSTHGLATWERLARRLDL
ncbi:MAG: hypothetical protein U0Y82_15035 [Thermoleophilia bacterium]